MGPILRREYVFLRRPLNLVARILMVLAAVLLVASALLPLWKIRLVAPQYQEGLELDIYSYRLVGGNDGQDLNEINGLNHYIGMKPIAAADFVEMRWVPFALGVFVLLALRAAAVGLMLSLVDLLALFVYFSAFSFAAFYFRMYTYGHQLDPHAPVHIQPFTPVLIGTQHIANFVQSSYPQSGSYCLAAIPVLLVLAMWFSRKEEP
jgi:copper chaperone NosL